MVEWLGEDTQGKVVFRRVRGRLPMRIISLVLEESRERSSWRRPPVEIPRWSGLSSRDYPPAARTTTREGLLPGIGSVGGISSAMTRAFLLLLRDSSPYAYAYVYYKYINIHTIARRTVHTCMSLRTRRVPSLTK